MQAGLKAQGEQSMAEALKRARSLTGLPPLASAQLEASIEPQGDRNGNYLCHRRKRESGPH